MTFFLNNRKGVSQVIEQVLMIALVILIVSIIFIFLIPFIKGSFSDVQSCLDVQNKLVLIDSRFSCHDSNLQLNGLAIKSLSSEVKEFRISFTDSSGASTLYDVSEGPNPQGFNMLGRADALAAGSSNVLIPEESQQLIYIASGDGFVNAEVAPVVDGTICQVSDSIELPSCSSSVNLAFVVGNIDIFAGLS